MPQSLKFDTDEVSEFADLLEHAAGASVVEARKVVAKGALNIKTDGRRRASAFVRFKKIQSAVTYETRELATTAIAEIGPEQDRPQGNLAHIPEYGLADPATPPTPFMAPAGEAEAPRFAKAMEDLAAKVIEP